MKRRTALLLSAPGLLLAVAVSAALLRRSSGPVPPQGPAESASTPPSASASAPADTAPSPARSVARSPIELLVNGRRRGHAPQAPLDPRLSVDEPARAQPEGEEEPPADDAPPADPQATSLPRAAAQDEQLSGPPQPVPNLLQSQPPARAAPSK